MKFLFLPAILLTAFFSVTAQENTVHDLNLTRVKSRDVIQTYDNYVPKTIGSTYFFDEWSDATAVMGGQASDYRARYDIINQTLEIEKGGNIYDIPAGLVESFTLHVQENMTTKNIHFVNITKISDLSVRGVAFMAVIADTEELKVYKSIRGEMMKPNYNIALSTGSKDAKIIKKTEYFIEQDGKVVQLPKTKKKDILAFIEKYSPAGADFAVREKLNLKKDNDLDRLFEYIDSDL